MHRGSERICPMGRQGDGTNVTAKATAAAISWRLVAFLACTTHGVIVSRVHKATKGVVSCPHGVRAYACVFLCAAALVRMPPVSAPPVWCAARPSISRPCAASTRCV